MRWERWRLMTAQRGHTRGAASHNGDTAAMMFNSTVSGSVDTRGRSCRERGCWVRCCRVGGSRDCESVVRRGAQESDPFPGWSDAFRPPPSSASHHVPSRAPAPNLHDVLCFCFEASTVSIEAHRRALACTLELVPQWRVAGRRESGAEVQRGGETGREGGTVERPEMRGWR